MSEQLAALFERSKELAAQTKAIQAEQRQVRRQINEQLEQGGFGLIVLPYYPSWRERAG